FFQAEDGIRDDLVTGVQTCALPISISLLGCHIQVASSSRVATAGATGSAQRRGRRPIVFRAPLRSPSRSSPPGGCSAGTGADKRSEERRVGKEGRTGGGAGRGRKKE